LEARRVKMKMTKAIVLVGLVALVSILTAGWAVSCDIISKWINPPPPEEAQPEVLFFDDFDGGAKAAWSAASGTWIVRAGHYTIQEEADVWMNTYVKTSSSLQWRDYAVEVDVLHGDAVWEGGIIIRAQDDQNKMMLRWQHDDNLSLNIWIDGERERCEDAIVHPGLTEKARIRVEAVGNIYTVYVRQGDRGELVKRLWCENNTFTQGMQGLALRNKGWSIYHKGDTAFDNFKVIRLGQ
jgi:hypothetical protein